MHHEAATLLNSWKLRIRATPGQELKSLTVHELIPALTPFMGRRDPPRTYFLHIAAVLSSEIRSALAGHKKLPHGKQQLLTTTLNLPVTFAGYHITQRTRTTFDAALIPTWRSYVNTCYETLLFLAKEVTPFQESYPLLAEEDYVSQRLFWPMTFPLVETYSSNCCVEYHLAIDRVLASQLLALISFCPNKKPWRDCRTVNFDWCLNTYRQECPGASASEDEVWWYRAGESVFANLLIGCFNNFHYQRAEIFQSLALHFTRSLGFCPPIIRLLIGMAKDGVIAFKWT